MFRIFSPYTRVLCERKEAPWPFDAAATALTAHLLPYLLLGAFAFSAQTIVVRGYYAMQNTLFPALLGTAAVILLSIFLGAVVEGVRRLVSSWLNTQTFSGALASSILAGLLFLTLLYPACRALKMDDFLDILNRPLKKVKELFFSIKSCISRGEAYKLENLFD